MTASARPASDRQGRALLWVAAIVNTLIGVPVLLFTLYGWFVLIGLGGSDASTLALMTAGMFVAPLVGTVLLVGYWRAARGTLKRARLLWATSLAFNAVVLGISAVFIADIPLLSLLGGWALYMSALSAYRMRAVAF